MPCKYLKNIAALLLLVIFSQATVFAYDKKDYPKIKNLRIDTFDEMLKWDYTGDYEGAEVYSISSNGKLESLGTTQNVAVSYDNDGGTYLVKAINAADGDCGSVITYNAGDNMPVSITLNSREFYETYAFFDVTVTNMSDEYVGGVLDIRICDIEGNVISSSQNTMIVKGGQASGFKISQPSDDSRYKTVISFWDSVTEKRDIAAPVTLLKENPSASYVQAVIEKNNANAAEILELINGCNEKGIPTDYEYADYRIIERFSEYLREDLDNSEFDNVYYTENALNKMYEETKENLNAYLSGKKTAVSVPKYATGDMKIDGQSVYAPSTTGGEDSGERPTYFYGYGHFAGYGHFEGYKNDTEFFEDIGVNTIQVEIGPSYAWIYTPYFDGWGITESNSSSYTVTQDNTVVNEGGVSAKISTGKDNSGAVTIFQKVAVEPNKNYTLTAYMRSDKAADFSMYIGSTGNNVSLNGEFGLKKVTKSFTASATAKYTTVGFKVSGEAEVYIDSVVFTADGSDENLLINGSFENASESAYTFDPFSDKVDKLRNVLEDAEKNNIAVCVLLSPHYFPDKIINAYDIGLDEGTAFIKYIIDAPEAKNVIEQFMRGIIPIINEYDSLNSICLSNEPSYELNKSGDYYLEKWRALLKEKYGGDISKLNKLYKKADPGKYVEYKSFDDVDYKFIWYYAIDYMDLTNEVFSEWHKWMADIAKELAPEIPVHSKIMNYLQDRSHSALYNGTSYRYYDFMDLNGCDSGAVLDEDKKYLQEAIWYDYMRSINDAPIINSEDHLIANGSKDFDAYVADCVSGNVYMGAIHGRALGNMWVWERSYDEKNDFNGSILFRPDVISKVSKTTMDLNRNAYYIKALSDQKADVGILYSESSVMLGEMKYYANNKNSTGEQKNALYQAYAAAIYNGKNARFIVSSQLEKLDDFKVVIVPDAQYVTSETLTALAAYVKNGGKIIMMGDECLKYDDKKAASNSATVAEIYKNSDTVEYVALKNGILNTTESEFYSDIRALFKKYGLYSIEVRDNATGEPVNYVEYNVGVYNSKLIINLMSYENDKSVSIYVGGQLVSAARNIISGENVSENIKLSRFVPVTLEIEADAEVIKQLSE